MNNHRQTSIAHVLVFKTNIHSRKKVRRLRSLLKPIHSIIRWTVDIEDIDHVLRVETREGLAEKDIISLVSARGFVCEVLQD